MFVCIASQSMVWDAFDQVIQGSQVQAEAANDTPVSPVDASANANRAAVIQMICMYVAEFMIHRMSDTLKWSAENGVNKLAPVDRQFLCLPPTSVLSECLFNGVGLIELCWPLTTAS